MKGLLISLLAATTLCPGFAADQVVAKVKLVPSQGGEYEWFGTSISVNGDYAIIGAPGNAFLAAKSGSAYVYKRIGATWVEQTRLTRSSGKDSDLFGQSVSISGDRAVVGVPGYDIGRYVDHGAAIVYRRDGENWVPEATLVSGEPGGGGEFGYSVAVDGDYIIVGAPRDAPKGSAYIFMRSGTNWAPQAKLIGTRGPQGNKFGHSVAIDGHYAVVGDPEDEMNGPGSAYVFVRDGTSWSPQANLSGSDPEAFDSFGQSVAIDGVLAVVGAPGHSPKEPFSDNGGVGYIFRRVGTGWSEEACLRAAEPEDIDIPEYRAGTSVSISGSSVVLGAIHSHAPSAGALAFTGAAYLYNIALGNWVGEQKLVPGDGIEDDYFGRAVSIDGDYIIVGADLSDPRGNESGAAYAFGVTSAGQRTQPKVLPQIAVEPLEDRVFWDDDGSLQLTIRHAGVQGETGGPPQGTGAQSPSPSTSGEPVTVEITVNALPDFLEGNLVPQTFRLAAGENKQFQVGVVDRLPLIRNFEQDALFGANVEIKAWPEGDPKTLIFDDEFNIYRYLDAADDRHDDMTMSLAPTYRDGRDGLAIRTRKVQLWGVHPEAEAEFEIDPAKEFRVEMAVGSATFTFDPSAGEQDKVFTEDIRVRNKNKDRVAGSLLIEGKGTPTHKIFLNKAELVETLRKIAYGLTPDYHIHTALLTWDEIVLLRDGPTRQRIADRVQARMEQLLGPASPAIEFVGGVGDGRNTITFSWPTRENGPREKPGPITVSADYWPERIGEVEKVTCPQVGPFGHAGDVDGAAAFRDHIRDREEYSRAELHYRLATAMNKTPKAAIKIWVDSIVQHVGNEEPLSLDEDEIVNAVAKTAIHELGHTLGVVHTAATGVAKIPNWDWEEQLITWDGGQADSWFVLSLDSTETTWPLRRDATAKQIGYALRGLKAIWGPNIDIPRKRLIEEGFPRWVVVRFWGAFEGAADMPLLTVTSSDAGKPAGSGPNAPLTIRLEVVNKGRVGKHTIVEKDGAKQILHSAKGMIPGDTDIMAGGLNDTKGKLRFQPGLGLSGLKIGLHLSYEEEEIEDYARILERYYFIAPNGF